MLNSQCFCCPSIYVESLKSKLKDRFDKATHLICTPMNKQHTGIYNPKETWAKNDKSMVSLSQNKVAIKTVKEDDYYYY